MAFIAYYQGERVNPHGVESGTELECTKCNEPMHVVSSYPREGTLVVRHFRHNSEGNTAGGGGGECSGGESDLHARVKGIALDHVENHYDDISKGELEVPIGNRKADACAEFSAPRMPYGKGIAIEVQYRHDSKDIEAVERNHLQHGYSVLWIDAEEDYYPNQHHWIDLPAPSSVWPKAVPDHPSIDKIQYGEWLFDAYDERWETRHSMVADALNIDCLPPEVDIHLPPEHYEKVEQGFYRNQTWNELFPGTEYETAMAECDCKTSERTRVKGEIPFVHWLQKRRSGQYLASLQQAHQKGKDRRESVSEAQRRKCAETIHGIVVHNTANTQQPETIARHHINVIANHAGLCPKETEAGVLAAESRGMIEQTTEDRYRSATS